MEWVRKFSLENSNDYNAEKKLAFFVMHFRSNIA